MTVQLLDSTGAVLGSKALSLPPNKEAREGYRRTYRHDTSRAGSTWRVKATLPVQSLGLVADDSKRTVTPVVPAATQ